MNKITTLILVLFHLALLGKTGNYSAVSNLVLNTYPSEINMTNHTNSEKIGFDESRDFAKSMIKELTSCNNTFTLVINDGNTTCNGDLFSSVSEKLPTCKEGALSITDTWYQAQADENGTLKFELSEINGSNLTVGYALYEDCQSDPIVCQTPPTAPLDVWNIAVPVSERVANKTWYLQVWAYEEQGQIVCAKAVSDNALVLTITKPDACITGINFDAAPIGQEDITPGAAPYECDEPKTWTLTVVGEEIPAANVSGKVFENDIEVVTFSGKSVSYIVHPNHTYRVEFTAQGSTGDPITESSESVFFDCLKPIVQLIASKDYEFSFAGTVNISVFDFNDSSFDNCTSQDKLAGKIWHASISATAPTSFDDILNLPFSLTLDTNYVGAQTVQIYILDETGNWQDGTAIANVGGGSNTTDICDQDDLVVSTIEQSLYHGRNTLSSTATLAAGETTAFKAGTAITLMPGFQAAGLFSAIIEDCPSTFVESPTAETFAQLNTKQPAELSEHIAMKIFPNPFVDETTIDYQLPTAGAVTIQLFDFMGRPVTVLERGVFKEKGSYQVNFRADELVDGTYFVVLESGGYREIRKMVVVKN